MDLGPLIRKKLARWEEHKHKRAGDGKFGEGAGDAAPKSDDSKSDKKPKAKSKSDKGPTDKKKRAPKIKKQEHDESTKDTPEYDARIADKKVAKIKKEIEALKAEYRAQYGEEPPDADGNVPEASEKTTAKPKEPKFKWEESKGPISNPVEVDENGYEKITDLDYSQATTEQEQALSDYGGISYNTINRMLRGLEVPEGLVEKNQARVAAIDAVMNTSRLLSDRKVIRGMSNMGEFLALGEDAIGTTLHVPNYWSTTSSTKVASAFSAGNDSVQFEINLKKGQRAIAMEYFKGTKPGSFSEEEVLLPRDVKYRVTGRKVAGGVTTYTLEVENDGE